MQDNVYIEYLPKNILLLELWLNAKFAPNLAYCHHKLEIPSLDIINQDIYQLYQNKKNNEELKCGNVDNEISLYYGKMMYIDILPKYCDVHLYNKANGYKSAQHIITKLKKHELMKTIKYYWISK